jgi:hypothetical protein
MYSMVTVREFLREFVINNFDNTHNEVGEDSPWDIRFLILKRFTYVFCFKQMLSVVLNLQQMFQ